jgi:hypothetical protein
MEIYKQYAELVQASKAIETQLDELKAKIVEDMKTREVKSDKQEFGTFTLASRKKVSYSDNIKELENSVKLAKIEEEEQGIATIEQTEFLTFKA